VFTIQFTSPDLTAAINSLAAGIRGLTAQLVRMSRPSRPSGLTAHLQGERMATKKFLTYSVQANPPSDSTVVTRRLRLTVDGVAVSSKDYSKDAAFENFEVAAGAAVQLYLTDLDDVGNESTPDAISFTAQDTIPPAGPSGLGVSTLSERDQDVPDEQISTT
jgi:hypothetical protein